MIHGASQTLVIESEYMYYSDKHIFWIAFILEECPPILTYVV